MSKLPQGWAETTIGQCQARTLTIDPRKYAEERFALYSVPSYTDYSPEDVFGHQIGSSKQIVEPDDVLLCKIVPHIRRGWTIPIADGRRQIASGEWIVFRGHGLESEYLRYFVLSDGFHRQFMQTIAGVGGSLTRARPTEAARIQIPVPPLPEQRRIVAKVDSFAGKSKRARNYLDHIPRLVEKYKQAILAAAFRGDLTHEWRDEHSASETAVHLVARIDPPAQSRGGREATANVVPGVAGLSINDPGTKAPEGWSWIGLRRIARQETGHTPSRSKSSYWDGGIPWIGIRDAGSHHGRVIHDTAQTISEEGLANSSARLLPAGTVCLSRTASVGYVTVMGRPMATSQDFATWTCTEALLPAYLMYALIAEGEHIRKFGEGSTHTTIYFPEIRALHICLAPVEEQKEIVRRIETAFAWIDRIAVNATSARTLLDRLDQAILAKAFRGELVPQDPNDEPASVLLERIRAERAKAPKPRRGRRKTA